MAVVLTHAGSAYLLAAEPAEPATSGLSGLTGWAADIIETLGSFGVGLITLLETVVPPIPSEAVLPLAGYLAGRDRVSLPGILVAATVGSVLGALLFYGLAAKLGPDRARRAVDRIPLMRGADVDRANDWFERHGRLAVFTGRLIPGVRSLVSLPAGSTRMPLHLFVLYTTLGSALWNSLLIGAGLALSSRWRQVEKYSNVLDVLVVGALVVLLGLAVRRAVRDRRADRDHAHDRNHDNDNDRDRDHRDRDDDRDRDRDRADHDHDRDHRADHDRRADASPTGRR